ncbi:inactive dipeptidyl peptidase 10 [Sarotherodon galilaeus]
MNHLSQTRKTIKSKIRDFFMKITEDQWRALKTGCSDENTKQVYIGVFHITITEVMPMIKHCQGVGEKRKHCACCPHSCTQQLNQEDPQSAGLESVSEVAEGAKSGPVAEPTGDSKKSDSSLECEVCETEPTDPFGDVTVEPPLLEQQRLVKELINAVIIRASREAKVPPSDEIQQQLFISLWAQIKEKTINIKRNRVKSLEKVIFKDIQKLLEIPPNLVIIALGVAQPDQQVVISIFKDRLLRKKRNLLTRLFAWCGKTQDDGDQTKKISQTLLEEFKENIFPLLEEKSQSVGSRTPHDAEVKERVSTLIHDVLSHAKTSHYKPSVKLHKLLFDNMVSDDRIKDLYIDKKKLKRFDEAIYQELRSKTFCEDKHLIMLLNDMDLVLQNLTIQIIKKYLIESMENPALSAAEEVQKYRSSLEICIEDLVKHVVENADSPCSSEEADAIAKRLSSQVWLQMKNVQIPAEYVPLLSNMVYKSLIEKWKDPDVILTFMSLDHRYVHELIINKSLRLIHFQCWGGGGGGGGGITIWC